MFLQGCRCKWKETSIRDSFKLSKKNLTHGCFDNLANDFRVRTNGRKQQHYKRLKQIRYFNIDNIDKC